MKKTYSFGALALLLAIICSTQQAYAITADFTVSETQICADRTVSFTDQSSNGIPTAWLWDFGNGTTSTQQNPIITYPASGIFDVTLIVFEIGGVDTIVKPGVIKILPATGILVAPVFEGFESPIFPSIPDTTKQWHTSSSLSFIDWFIDTNSTHSGHNSYLLKLSGILSNTILELTSPPIDLTTATSDYLEFHHAYAMRSASSNDKLRVYASKDCGANWILIFAANATNLATNQDFAFVAPIFVPTADEWTQNQVSLVQFLGRDNVLIKFEVEAGQGNRFYLDDINVGGRYIDGIEEEMNSNYRIQIYPTPVIDQFSVELNAQKTGKSSIKIFNLLGKEVYSDVRFIKKGANVISISNIHFLRSGVYTIQIIDGSASYNGRFVKK